jgi:hypothetical protein
MPRRASWSAVTRPPPQAGVSGNGNRRLEHGGHGRRGSKSCYRPPSIEASSSAAPGRMWSSAWKLDAPVHATRMFDYIPLIGAVCAATGGGDADRAWRLNRPG